MIRSAVTATNPVAIEFGDVTYSITTGKKEARKEKVPLSSSAEALGWAPRRRAAKQTFPPLADFPLACCRFPPG